MLFWHEQWAIGVRLSHRYSAVYGTDGVIVRVRDDDPAWCTQPAVRLDDHLQREMRYDLSLFLRIPTTFTTVSDLTSTTRSDNFHHPFRTGSAITPGSGLRPICFRCSRGRGRRQPLPQRFALDGQPVRMMHQAVEDRIGHGRIRKLLIPLLDWQLAGNGRRALFVPALDEVQQIATFVQRNRV